MATRPTDARTPVRTPTLVVGVGASAGGLEAFKRLLPALPVDAGMAFVLVQHLDPNHKSLLTELLTSSTAMPVVEARQGLTLEPDTVYVIQPGTALGIRAGRLDQTRPTLHRGVRLPVDHLFRSLARECGTSAVGIALSGAGSDGSEGLRVLKAAGGLTIAQEPASGGRSGMPQSAIATGAVDLVLAIEDMPAALQRFAALPATARNPVELVQDTPVEPLPPLPEATVAQMAALIEAREAFDLRVYKAGTVQRRVYRRMALAGVAQPDDYVALLRHDAAERRALVRDLLISVTEFFRDPEVFAALRPTAIEPLGRSLGPGDTFRVWVAGCATGEEAYSVAMECLDAFERSGVQTRLQVFATDLDDAALSVARAGLYPFEAADRIGSERVAKYFRVLDGRGIQVVPALRDVVSFASHDVTRDPPFSRMHLVTCRNLLIYLKPDTQVEVLRQLHFALLPGGYLLLGTSESTGGQRAMFTTVSTRWRLFRRAGASKPMVNPRTRPRASLAREGAASGATVSRPSFADQARQHVLQARVPPSVVVGAGGSVLFMHGELRPYLQFPDGEPRLEIAELIAPQLLARVRAALYRCRRDHGQVVVDVPPVDGSRAAVRITASPAPELGDEAVLVSFEKTAREHSQATPLESTGTDLMAHQLERELAATREDLRNTVEELESANEELRSSNEESMSMNEELQSANEELEATTEELRSLNEELTTVNAQLREKVTQVEQAHDDLTNFFRSTQIATVFLDDRLCIKRFTPAAGSLLRIDRPDVGRFVGDIARDLLQEGLVDEARQVLEQQPSMSREIPTATGWVIRQVLPYSTESRRARGVVVTFTDVTALKVTADRLARRERQQAVVARLGLRALEEPRLHVFFEQVVRAVQEVLGTDYCDVLELQPTGRTLAIRAGVGWEPGIVGRASVDNDPRSQAGFTLSEAEPVIVRDLQVEARFSGSPLLVDRGVVSGVSCVIQTGDDPYGVLGAHTTTPRVFTPEDTHFLQATAAVIAGAINRHSTRLRLALEAGAAKALGGAETLEEAIRGLHAAASVELGPGIGELWQLQAGEMRRTSTFDAMTEPPTAGRAAGSALSPRAGGWLSRIIVSGRAEWLTQYDPPDSVLLTDAARRLGLSSGLAIPIASEGRTIGVVTYFAVTPAHADSVLLRSLEAIGRTIGDFTRRLEVERRVRATIDQAPVGIADRSLDGRWLHVNQRLCEITGYRAEELVGRSFKEIVHPEDLEREVGFAEALRSGAIDQYAIEKRYIRKDGASAWVQISAARVERPSGEPGYSVVVIEDISARKAAEDALRLSESRFREVLRASPVPLMLYDADGQVLAVSDSWTEFTGYTAEEIGTADRWTELAYRDRAAEMKRLAAAVWAEAPMPRRYEHQIWLKSGQVRTVLLSAVPVGVDSRGRRLRVAAALDLTPQRAFEAEVALASRQKDDFIAMLSHELRNPLAAVRLATELLSSAAVEHETVQRAQEVLQRQTAHMAKLLDGLLDISRIVRGRIEIDHVPVDLAEVVRAVAADASATARRLGIDLSVQITPEPVWVVGDAVRLTQIVDNLVGNALKFTPSTGAVAVQLGTEGERAVVTVTDTGIGIKAELLPNLFEVFHQGQQRLDRAMGGLGLGLALVKVLTELHGGSVEATSEGEGRGAELVVRLPRGTPPAAGSGDVAPDRTPSRRVLIIEDNRDAAEMLAMALAQLGHVVDVRHRGRDAVALAQAAPPDVVLCDIGLPDGMSGYEVARALRKAAQGRSIFLVALSGYGRPEDRERATAAGFDVHVTKPASLDQLKAILRDLPATGQ